jgi:predicted enzyme related to lactoylglutathione lyase
MQQSIVHVALLVREYDEAIEFFTVKLNFELVEDRFVSQQNKRWVLVAPKKGNGFALLLARAADTNQAEFIGNQSGGRVFLFLSTDDFWRDYKEMLSRGIKFVRPPAEFDYGTVAVFEDLYGNRWDLLENKGPR